MLKLNLGCGGDYREGYVNVDKYADTCDIKCDLEQLPWPWETNSVNEVLLKHVLEHLGQQTDLYLGIIKELYRVCAPNALITIEVPYPLHSDYLGDPTHCRPVTAEGLWLFNREYADHLIKIKAIGTPLATYLGVDFVMIENTEYRDHAGNLQASRFVLKVLKPIKMAVLSPGLGDIVMGLGTAHALSDAGFRVSLTALERYHEVVKASPHVYAVSETDRKDEIWTCAWNQLQNRHQIDECLAMCGLNPELVPAESKSAVLKLDPNIVSEMEAKFPGKDRIIICTACSAISRKWPAEKWQELVDRFNNDGIEVVSSGMTTKFWQGPHGADKLHDVKEVFDIPILNSIALYNQSRLLISSDSAPIHLAGATETGILGLFSVISPDCRLPYRHGKLGWNAYGIKTPCKYSPCYPNMVTDHDFVWSDKAIAEFAKGVSVADVIDQWCDNTDDYKGCMKHITVDEVYNKAIEMYNNV
jgi:ADP-heptose:LPS heptosyltransferase